MGKIVEFRNPNAEESFEEEFHSLYQESIQYDPEKIKEECIRFFQNQKESDISRQYELRLAKQLNAAVALEVYFVLLMRAINEDIQKNQKEKAGLGFKRVEYIFKDYPIVKTFIARHMLEDIYQEDDYFNLEAYLHNRFHNKEELLKIGIEEYIKNSIYGYDPCLRDYLTVHKDLMQNVKERIEKIVDNWERYDQKWKEGCLAIISEICAQHDVISEMDLIQYTTKELGIDVLSVYEKELEEEGFYEEDDWFDDTLEDYDYFVPKEIAEDLKKRINRYRKTGYLVDNYVVDAINREDKIIDLFPKEEDAYQANIQSKKGI